MEENTKNVSHSVLIPLLHSVVPTPTSQGILRDCGCENDHELLSSLAIATCKELPEGKKRG